MTEQMPNEHQNEGLKAVESQTNTPETVEPTPQINAYLGKFAAMLEAQGVAAESIGEVTEATVSNWKMVTNNHGVAEEHDLEALKVRFKPKKGSMNSDEPLQLRQAPPVIIRPGRSMPKRFRDKVAVIIPDPQIGYRNLNGIMVPVHDEAAFSVGHQIIRDIQPDRIISVGDNLDLASIGRWDKERSFVGSIQPSIDRLGRMAAQLRADVPNSEIVFLEGNHDLRLQKLLQKEAPELFALRRANTEVSEDEVVLGIPFLSRFGELAIKYVAGYPANKFWINDKLQVIHGDVVRSGGSTVAAYLDKYEESTISGHTHRAEFAAKTVSDRYKTWVKVAASFGTWSRVDGHTPGVGQGLSPTGEPVGQAPNWQQAVGIVTYKEGDGPFDIQTVMIHTHDNHQATFDNKTYLPLPSQKAESNLRVVRDAA